MAIANDRRDVTPARRQRMSWLGLVGIGLVLALLAVALVQARQFSLLRHTVQPGDDYSVLTIFQAETEYLRLREQWCRAMDERIPFDAAALRVRFDIWVSRVDLLHADRPSRLIVLDDEFRLTLKQVQAFIDDADRALGPHADTALDRGFMQRLWPTLEALGKPMHGMSLSAAHRVGEQMEERAQAVKHQSQLGIALTLFLSVLTLAFAAIALRQVRQLRERRGELEELAAHLRGARRDAEAASEAKSAFLANMSHEIRTPFHGLMGMLSLLRETGLNPRQIDYLRTATESADHLLAILNDILDMSQLESGRMVLSPTLVELRTLLRDIEALMRPQANAKQLALHIDADPAVPERVKLDATRVKQIVFNLLSNAIKFSDRGAVVLDVRCGSGSDGKPTLEFVVTDTGIGMDAATLERLFNRFVQGDSSPSRRHGGTGLGLEISRTLARLMGGDLSARSKLGSGSCFTFSMPLVNASDGTPTPTQAQAAAVPTPRRALQVLVAEDHAVNRQYLAALLESLGHEAHFTANGQEALDALQQPRAQRFDVVLMDVHMPVLDGIAATRAIRALPDPQLNTVPIVALTADAFPETRDRCLVAGMNDFLTKPLSPQTLGASLRRLFGTTMVDVAPQPMPPPRADVGVNPPLVDEAAIARSLQAMPRARLAAMIAAFLDQGDETVQRLRSAVRNAQPLDLRVNAHAAKGAALNLGLAGLAATAEALQEGAAHLPAHEVARLVRRYEDQLVATRAVARDLGLLPPQVH